MARSKVRRVLREDGLAQGPYPWVEERRGRERGHRRRRRSGDDVEGALALRF